MTKPVARRLKISLEHRAARSWYPQMRTFIKTNLIWPHLYNQNFRLSTLQRRKVPELFKFSFGGNFFSNGGETKILIGQMRSNRGQPNAWFGFCRNSQARGDGVSYIQLVHRAPRIENADKRGKLSIDRDSGWTRIKHAGTRSFDAEICQY